MFWAITGFVAALILWFWSLVAVYRDRVPKPYTKIDELDKWDRMAIAAEMSKL